MHLYQSACLSVYLFMYFISGTSLSLSLPSPFLPLSLLLIGFLCADLELTLQTTLPSNSEIFVLSVGIKDMCHHCLVVHLF